jgi:hypothetical protein
VPVSTVLTVALLGILVLASNSKYAMLGEPLLFSDLALVGAIFRHPQFYLSAVPMWQRVGVTIAVAALMAVLAWLFVADVVAHAMGLAIALISLSVLAFTLRTASFANLARSPRHDIDVRKLGLTPTLMLYWLRWRATRDPMPCPPVARAAPQDAPKLLVVIQCESFADPVELFGNQARALPELSAACANAWQYGALQVSGFGAYTMRTEYGVLFGREEGALGFRRYDPFLTALGESSYALPAQLGQGWRSLFIRDAIMPAAGFSELVGEDRFAAPTAEQGRYVTDAALTDEILRLARTSMQPTLLYAVTIENHGPWAPDARSGTDDLVGSYTRLAQKSDAMLGRLIAELATMGRSATLVFFGDHRPSIPGATDPGGDKHTPYVIVRIDRQGRFVRGENRRQNVTPAGLHHAMLDIVLGNRV